MFVPSESILEIVIRGTIMYLGMYFILRLFRRQSGAIGTADLLVLVVIADAAQNGMAGDSRSITEALILITTIVLWDVFFDWLGFKSTFARRLLEPSPLLIIENGKFVEANLRQEFLTEDDVMGTLREHGLENAASVKRCYLESSGHFSVVLENGGGSQKPDATKAG
ncbi:MAG: hypothetical protein UZ17_ACD001002084 [Acidobacteria bacterium OLB17]|nr:MAG: hypothetical protein UZ17_ACD001002084 [Acidobacteria bacterium OLB17]